MKRRPASPSLPPLIAGATVSLAAALISCGPKNTFVAPPPPEVNVRTPEVRDVTVYEEFPGHTEAFATVEIRARVKGFLEKRHFHPGSYVNKDELLFTIEPEQFQAAVDAAEGKLESARATLEIAETTLEKRTLASKSGAVSMIDVAAAQADRDSAAANIKIEEATLRDAKRDLAYTRIISPIEGRVSRGIVTAGNLVGAAEPTLLTTVVQDNPLYVNFDISERIMLGRLEERPAGEDAKLGDEISAVKLALTLSDGSVYPVKGTFDYLDNVVDAKTGTMRARAIFQNDKGFLAGGLFVRVGIPIKIEGAVLVPRTAIQRDLGGSFVLVADKDNVARRRVVEASKHTINDLKIVTKGLAAEDRVIVSNLQRVRDGIDVKPVVAAPEEEKEAEKKAEPEAKPDKTPPAKKGN